jgi:NAD(P)-dependent dehydrogenase (short-subunit alcohol dehydrogenase family)
MSLFLGCFGRYRRSASRAPISQKAIFERLGQETFTKSVPLRRIGDEEDLKGAAPLFVSDAGKHITGQILAIDGGATADLSPPNDA